MKLLVTIDYNTTWGEELVFCVAGNFNNFHTI